MKARIECGGVGKALGAPRLFTTVDLVGEIVGYFFVEFAHPLRILFNFGSINHVCCAAALSHIFHCCGTCVFYAETEAKKFHVQPITGYFANAPMRLIWTHSSDCGVPRPLLSSSDAYVANVSPCISHPCGFTFSKTRCVFEPKEPKPIGRFHSHLFGLFDTRQFLAWMMHVGPVPSIMFDPDANFRCPVAAASASANYALFTSDPRTACMFPHMASCNATGTPLTALLLEGLRAHEHLVTCHVFGLPWGPLAAVDVEVPCTAGMNVAEFKWLLKMQAERDQRLAQGSEGPNPSLLLHACTLIMGCWGVLSDADYFSSELLYALEDKRGTLSECCYAVLERRLSTFQQRVPPSGPSEAFASFQRMLRDVEAVSIAWLGKEEGSFTSAMSTSAEPVGDSSDWRRSSEPRIPFVVAVFSATPQVLPLECAATTTLTDFIAEVAKHVASCASETWVVVLPGHRHAVFVVTSARDVSCTGLPSEDGGRVGADSPMGRYGKVSLPSFVACFVASAKIRIRCCSPLANSEWAVTPCCPAWCANMLLLFLSILSINHAVTEVCVLSDRYEELLCRLHACEDRGCSVSFDDGRTYLFRGRLGTEPVFAAIQSSGHVTLNFS